MAKEHKTGSRLPIPICDKNKKKNDFIEKWKIKLSIFKYKNKLILELIFLK